MKKLEKEALLADRQSVVEILEDISAEDLTGKLTFQGRLKEIDERLSQVQALSETKGSVALMFGGEPVKGSRAIDAQFASAALRTFQDLVTKRVASEEIGQLGSRGRIPLRAAANLAITELVRGSVGFLLEEDSSQDEIADTAVKVAIEEVADVITKAASENENDFEQAVENVDARLLVSLRDFFKTLDEGHATLRIVEEERDETLDRYAVRRARQRVDATQIAENEIDLQGELLGLLPEGRRFEMKLESGEVIRGAVGATLAADWLPLIEQSKQPMVGRRWQTRMKVREVRERNRPPRKLYTLLRVLRKL